MYINQDPREYDAEIDGSVEVTNLDMEQVMLLIHQNALEEMMVREARLIRQMRRLQEDLDQLGNDIREKKFMITAARDALLRRAV
jgi:hypothetical protein